MARRARKAKQPAVKREWERLPLVEEVVQEIVKAHHHHLEHATIVVLGKPTASKSGGKTNVAKAKRAMPALNALVKDEIGEVSYIIEVGLDVWDALDQKQRRIVLDHELMHFSGLDDETGKWGLLGHDVECFTEEIKRYGAWNEDLRGFLAAIKQLSLFEEPGPRQVSCTCPAPKGRPCEAHPLAPKK